MLVISLSGLCSDLYTYAVVYALTFVGEEFRWALALWVHKSRKISVFKTLNSFHVVLCVGVATN